MIIPTIKDEQSIYSNYVRTILEEYFKSLNIEKKFEVEMMEFKGAINSTYHRTFRAMISNPWKSLKERLNISTNFDVFQSRMDGDDEGTLDVRIFSYDKLITEFKIVTLHIEYTQKKILKEMEQTIHDLLESW